VDISALALGFDYAVIHEVVHALRHHQGRDDANIVKEEVWTDLETLARVPYACIRQIDYGWGKLHRLPNYWDYLGEKGYEAFRADRRLLTGGLKQNIGNARAVARVRAVYAQTKLAALDGRASFRRNLRPWMVI
jgi:hypothetical protein